MSTQTAASSPARPPTLYPPEGWGAPKYRQGHAAGVSVGLPAGTEVFSADNHISVGADILIKQSPDDVKGGAPWIWCGDAAEMEGVKGRYRVGCHVGRVVM